MKRLPIDSTSLASIGYDAVGQILELEFHNGGVYQYFGVSPKTYEELLNAESRGRYFMAHIRDRYRYRLVSRAE